MQKKIPQRQCMGCRERKPKRDMIRIVRTPEGVVSLDFGGKMNGRGAYICPDPECLKKVRSPRPWSGAWKFPFPTRYMPVW